LFIEGGKRATTAELIQMRFEADFYGRKETFIGWGTYSDYN